LEGVTPIGQAQNFKLNKLLRITEDIAPNITLHYVYCENLEFKLKMSTAKSALELPLEKLLSKSSVFNYAGHSVDQVEQLILQNEAELNRERSSDQLNFLSRVGIATVIVILMFLYFCFCKKCKCWKSWIDHNCCGRICIHQR
jgi:hypothetical protein